MPACGEPHEMDGVTIDGPKADIVHALRAVDMDDARNHFESSKQDAIRHEIMTKAKAEKILSKRALRERARREKKKQLWADRHKVLAPPEQPAESCDDDDDSGDDKSDSTNGSDPHVSRSSHKMAFIAGRYYERSRIMKKAVVSTAPPAPSVSAAVTYLAFAFGGTVMGITVMSLRMSLRH